MANFVFQCRNAGLLKYTYMYTAVQLMLFEITNLSYNFCDKFAKLQNDEIPRTANVAFQ